MAEIPNDFMKGFNKPLILQKLKEIGMGDVAKTMLRANPSILRKATEMMKGGK